MTATKSQRARQLRQPSSPRVPPPDGILLVDKPGGKTSHDIVNVVRKRLATKQVGHAGTLDPMATGLLVVLVGTATRLASFATGAEKSYAARICFGATTDSLDADGAITETAPVPDDLRAELRALAAAFRAARDGAATARSQPNSPEASMSVTGRDSAASTGSGASMGSTGVRAQPLTVEIPTMVATALERERARTAQVPPVVSAIHVGGERSYDMARRGERPELAARDVSVTELSVVGAEGDAELPWLDVEIAVSKGYYVRSLARDIGASLGVPAHLTALRRLRSGGFDVGEAVGDDEKFREHVLPLRAAIDRLLPSVEITDEGLVRSRQGKPLTIEHFVGEVTPDVPVAWLHDGVPVAVGQMRGDIARVIRGFPS